MSATDALGYVLAATFVLMTVVTAAFIVLSLAFHFRQQRLRESGNFGIAPYEPAVSVVVPAYNEERVIDACVASILGCGYRNLEVILVDDGSTDRTAERMHAWATASPLVRTVVKPNGGKGAALNAGARIAQGEILMFVDADGVFTANTIPAMLRAFDDPTVGAVCGNDRPANLDRVLTRFLAFVSHVGTGMVRRALHVLNCVPVVSGNIGAFRTDALLSVTPGIQPLRTDTLGEDLELTWRLRLAGWRVAFEPTAIVYAESPSTLAGLWKQRVRWARGLLQGLRIHQDAVGSGKYGLFGYFLAYQVIAAVVVPAVQVVAVSALATTLVVPRLPSRTVLEIGVLGLVIAGVIATYAIVLDDAEEHLRYLWTLPLWPLYSLGTSAAMIRAIFLEAAGRPNAWNKLERTGVISYEATSRSCVPRDALGVPELAHEAAS